MLAQKIRLWLNETCCSSIDTVKMRLYATMSDNWCIELIPEVNHPTYIRMATSLYRLIERTAYSHRDRTLRLTDRTILMPCRTCRRFTNGRCSKCGMEAYCNVDCQFINEKKHYFKMHTLCGMYPSTPKRTIPEASIPFRGQNPHMSPCASPPNSPPTTPNTKVLALRGGGPALTSNDGNGSPSVPDQVGGVITKLPTLASGPNKLTRLFDAMDAISTTTKIEHTLLALAVSLGHSNPNQAILDAIYAVLLRAVKPDKYTSDKCAQQNCNVKQFLFNAWRFRLHTLSHSIPVAACELAKVIFILPSTLHVMIWVGSRRNSAKEEHVFDLPGGDNIQQDVNSRATAWRNVADRDLKLSPITRSRLARTLSCNHPMLINQLHPHNGITLKIALWPQIICTEEKHHIQATTQARLKWAFTGWINIDELIKSIEEQGLADYANGCKEAIEASLRCHETLPPQTPKGSRT